MAHLRLSRFLYAFSAVVEIFNFIVKRIPSRHQLPYDPAKSGQLAKLHRGIMLAGEATRLIKQEDLALDLQCLKSWCWESEI